MLSETNITHLHPKAMPPKPSDTFLRALEATGECVALPRDVHRKIVQNILLISVESQHAAYQLLLNAGNIGEARQLSNLINMLGAFAKTITKDDAS